LNITHTSPKTKAECQKIIFNLGVKCGVSPKLIAIRMLNAQDKCDMLNGDLGIEELEQRVIAAKANGMFINDTPLQQGIKKGSNRLPAAQPEQPLAVKCHYRKPFVCPDWRTDCHCRAVEIAE
jgi:hypothetical protein